MNRPKLTCLDIELKIMYEFKFLQNIIVTNVSNMMGVVPFEVDVLIVSKYGYAHGVEIKTSRQDLKKDFLKRQHVKLNSIMHNGKTGYDYYFGKFKHFSYAVPECLKEDALELIPEFCGLYVFTKDENTFATKMSKIRPPKKISDYKWTEKERHELTRLGTMRIYSLKQKQKQLLGKLNNL